MTAPGVDLREQVADLLGNAEAVHLQPDDVLVIKAPSITPEMAHAIQEAFTGRKVVILGPGVEGFGALPMREPAVSGDGTAYQVTPERQQQHMADRLEEDMAAAERHGEHLWIVAAAWRISPAAAGRIAAGEPAGTLLDGENLLNLTPGCYRCEAPLTPTTFHRRCRGEATGG